jgi:hypothetical protein
MLANPAAATANKDRAAVSPVLNRATVSNGDQTRHETLAPKIAPAALRKYAFSI